MAYWIFHAVAADTSRWTPNSARRQNRENGHTDTQENYCNRWRMCVPRVKINNHMWQSSVEIEGHSVAYFNHIAVFETPYC